MEVNTFKARRLWKGLSMREAAKVLGISASTISLIENGYREPSQEVRAAYARAFPIDDSYYSFLFDFEKTLEYP